MEYIKAEQKEQIPIQEELMEDFYKKIFESSEEGIKRISLDQLRELKEKEITTEIFWIIFVKNKDYCCMAQSKK